MGNFVKYRECPSCGSKDNLAIYTDGEYCYTPGCKHRKGERHPERFPYVEWRNGFETRTISGRRITDITCLKFDVRSRGKVIGFPYIYKGVRYGIKYRDFNFSKLQRNAHMQLEGEPLCTFFGWQAIASRKSRKVLAIAGGEFDAVSVTQLVQGMPCVSPPNGDKSLVQVVKFHLEELLLFEEIYLIPDNDAASYNAFMEAGELLDKNRTKIVSLAYKDPSEYLQHSYYDLFRKTFYAAQSLSDGFIRSKIKGSKTNSRLIKADIRFYNGAIKGIRTGEVTILLGRTGQGKSTCARWVSLQLALSNYKTGVFSCEESGDSYAESLDALFTEEGMDVDSYVVLSTLHGTLDLDKFRAAVGTMVKIHGVKYVILDNLTAAASATKSNESLNAIMKLVNELAAEHNIHFLCVSHTSRDSEQRNELAMMQGKPSLPPTRADAYGSSFIEKFGWNYITIHVKNVGVTQFTVSKTRKGDMALPCTTIMSFSKGHYLNS